MGKAMAWDTASVRGVRPTTGFAMAGHEIPYDRPAAIYERNGVTISCFPAIHGLSGAVGATPSPMPGSRWSSPGTRAPASMWWRRPRARTC